jgi:hypothetical protein
VLQIVPSCREIGRKKENPAFSQNPDFGLYAVYRLAFPMIRHPSAAILPAILDGKMPVITSTKEYGF